MNRLNSSVSFHDSPWFKAPGYLLPLFIALIMAFSGGLAHPEGREGVWFLCGLFGIWGILDFLFKPFEMEKRRTLVGYLVVALLLIFWCGLQLLPPSLLGYPWLGKGFSAEFAGVTPASWAWNTEAATRGLHQLIGIFCVVLGGAALARDVRGRFFLVLLLILISFTQAFVGFFTLGFSQNRAMGLLVNPNHHAASVFIGIPLLVGWLREALRRLQERMLYPFERDLMLLGLGMLIVMLFSWMSSFSRGSLFIGWLAMTSWALLEVVARIRLKSAHQEEPNSRAILVNRLTVVFILSGLIILVVWAILDEGRGRGTEDSIVDLDTRLLYWQATLQGFQESHFLGMGIGGTRFAINRYITGQSLETEPVFAHNDWVQWLGDTGAPGFLLLLVLWGLFVRQMVAGMRKDLRGQGRWREKRLWRAALVAFLALWLHAFVEFHFRVPLVGLQMGLLFALLTSYPRLRCEDVFFSHR